VLQVLDWVGGSGTKPATGLYVGAAGLTAVLADAVDIRGATGPSGSGGSGVGGIPWTTGRWYTNLNTGGADVAPTLATAYASPILVPSTVPVDKLAMDITLGKTSGLIHLGIYDTNAAGLPGALLREVTPFLSGAGSAMRTASLTAPLALTPGWYWLAGLSTGSNVQWRALNAPTASAGWSTSTSAATPGANTATYGMVAVDGTGTTSGFSSLPAQFTADGQNASRDANGVAPKMWMHTTS
jgi:hypothetical protein